MKNAKKQGEWKKGELKKNEVNSSYESGKMRRGQVKSLGAKQVLVTGQCRGETCYMFVDSGSSVNLVSSGFIRRVGIESEMKPCNLKLKSFSQDNIPIRGEIKLKVTMADSEFTDNFVVSDFLDTEFLVGDPFLRQSEVSINYRDSILRLPSGSTTPFKEKPMNVTRPMRVKCRKTTIVPPNSMMYIEGKLPPTQRDLQGLIEPSVGTMVTSGLLLADAVVHSEQRCIPIKCINAGDEPIKIYKNRLLAHLQPLGEHKFIRGVRRIEKTEQCKINTGVNKNVHQKGDNIPVEEDEKRKSMSTKEKWTKEELFQRLKLDNPEIKMTNSEHERLKNIIWNNRACFSYDEFDIGCCNMYEANIQLKEGIEPCWTTPIPTPYKLQDEMEKQLGEMVKSGVIEPRDEPSEFNSPVFLVLKKTTPNAKPDSTSKSWRLVLDLRKVNSACLDEKYVLPNLNHVLDTIGSDSIFSCFDLSKSFWQVPYSKESRKMTAFLYKAKTYCFARVVMGHKNSSAIFQKMMDKLLASIPIEQLIFFIDDIFLSSSDVASHLDRLEVLLQRIASAGLRITPDKCKLMAKVAKFLGVSINSEGISITDDRVKDLQAIPPPTTVKGVQSLLGAFNYVRKWIPRYSDITKPLYKLTSKGSRFEWSKECQNSFDELKKQIAENTTLCIPDTADPFKSYHVTVDASKHGYGATLSQEIERGGVRERRIVAFFSKAVPPYKREQGQTRLEFDAMVLALKQWKVYLRNTSFKVITDCRGLLSASDNLFAKSDPTLIRKCQELANYDFIIEHVEGAKNTLCDFLSRFPFQRKLKNQGTQVGGTCLRNTDTNVRAMKIDIAVGTDEQIREIAEVESEWESSNSPKKVEQKLKTDTEVQPWYNETHWQDSEKEEEDKVGFETQEKCQKEEAHVADTVKETYQEKPQDDESVSEDSFKEEGVVVVEEDLTDLQLLFESDHDGDVKVITLDERRNEECLCGIPEMIESAPEKRVTFAVAEIGEEIQTLPDLKKLEEEQNKDPILKVVKQWVLDGDKGKIQVNRSPAALISYWKQFNMLKLEQGLLKRKWMMKKQEETRDLIVVPESCEIEVMKLFHDNVVNCHPGVKISVTRCRQFFYWPKMEQEFKIYIQACERCTETKQPHHYLKAPLKHLFFHCFNDALIIDHIVPEMEGRTPRGFRYILTMTDAWSNYLVAVPVKSQTAVENIKAMMKHWVLKHGICRELIVDNHPGFTADFFTAVWSYFNCKKTHGTSYKASSTARAEKSNKRVNQALRAVIPAGKAHCWDMYLDKVVFALNCLNNRRTGFSAHKMVYGREANIPLSLIIEKGADHQPVKQNQASKDAYELHREMKRVIRKVRENAETDFRYAQNSHDRNLLGPFFKEGNYCYVLVNCRKHKFDPKFRGPLRVNKVINDHLYVVQITPTMEKVINISKMKHYPTNKYSKMKLDRLDNAQTSRGKEDKKPQIPKIADDLSSSDEEDIQLETSLSPYALPFVPIRDSKDKTQLGGLDLETTNYPIVLKEKEEKQEVSNFEREVTSEGMASPNTTQKSEVNVRETSTQSSRLEQTYPETIEPRCEHEEIEQEENEGESFRGMSTQYTEQGGICKESVTAESASPTRSVDPEEIQEEPEIEIVEGRSSKRAGLRPRSKLKRPDFLTYVIRKVRKNIKRR